MTCVSYQQHPTLCYNKIGTRCTHAYSTVIFIFQCRFLSAPTCGAGSRRHLFRVRLCLVDIAVHCTPVYPTLPCTVQYSTVRKQASKQASKHAQCNLSQFSFSDSNIRFSPPYRPPPPFCGHVCGGDLPFYYLNCFAGYTHCSTPSPPHMSNRSSGRGIGVVAGAEKFILGNLL